MKSSLYLIFFIPLTHVFAQDSLKTLDLKEVVVTGQFEPQSLRQSVYQVRTIHQETIRQRAATNVQSILNTELGIRFSNDLTLGTSDISLMGMSGQNVKILLDGVPLLDRGATKESLNQIDVRTIERIEIVEGPMSVVYGSDALAGVINIITKKGIEDNQKFSVDASVQEETAGDDYRAFSGKGLHNESVSAAWQGSGWNASAGVTRNDFGGWKESRTADPAVREWHPKAQWLGTGTIGYKKQHFNLWYRLNYLKEDILSKESTYIDNDTKELMALDRKFITNRFTHQVQAEWKLNDRWSFNGIASYQDYSRKTQTTSVNLETGDRRLYLKEEGAQDKAEFDSKVFRAFTLHKWSTVVSMQTGVDINLNKGFGDRIDGTRSIEDYALFASAEISPVKSINIRPGLRFTHNSVYDAPPVIPSLNTKFSLTNNLDLRLAYAYGFRAPALRELYFSFHDASHDIDGNPDLKAEHSNSLTGSLTWRVYQNSDTRYLLTAGGFYNQFENMISLGNVDIHNPGLYTYINILKNKTTGFTLNNALYWKSLHVSAGFSYIGVYNLFSEEDSALPALMWTPEVNSTITYYFDKIGMSLGTFYKFTGIRSSYMTTTVNNEQRIARGEVQAYHWADITATKKMTKLFNLGAGVKNVFDVGQVTSSLNSGDAHSTGGPVPVGYGRSYFMTLSFRITQ
jgi:outer membrane receptor for ferrienterochelin and colicins